MQKNFIFRISLSYDVLNVQTGIFLVNTGQLALQLADFKDDHTKSIVFLLFTYTAQDVKTIKATHITIETGFNHCHQPL